MFSSENSSRSASRSVFVIASGRSRNSSRISAIALQMPLGILRQQFARRIEMRVLADAGENIEDFTPAWRSRTARRWSR